MVRLINTKLHGWIDYCFALSVIGFPWLFGYSRDSLEAYASFAVGGFIIFYSLFTNYEMGLLKWRGIPMKLHLFLDVVATVFLAAAPWIFHFNELTYLPFLSFGVIGFAITLLTDTVAYARLGPDAVRD
jgi:hypothetical protein